MPHCMVWIVPVFKMHDALQELAKTLQAVSEEKEKIEQRNAVLEKMATMQFNPEVLPHRV